MEKLLHIVAFNIPYPADYGGVIDIYYKVKALSEAGVEIILHCFEYGRTPQPVLEELCRKVYYYKRESGFRYLFSPEPYIVVTRKSRELLQNLVKTPAPVLFEGLHSCAWLNHPGLKDRLKIVRTHNVEHHYYSGLARAEKDLARKFYFWLEAYKLRQYEPKLRGADRILAISPSDEAYFRSRYVKTEYIPAFHPFNAVCSTRGRGEYALFHGNLSVAENVKAVNFLLDEVFSQVQLPFCVAGKNPSTELTAKIMRYPHVRLVTNPSGEEMDRLIAGAQMCVIPSFQGTGVKLKLLASLFAGRFCICNSIMVQNTGLEDLCLIGDSAKQIRKLVEEYFPVDFDQFIQNERRRVLETTFSNQSNAEKILDLIR